MLKNMRSMRVLLIFWTAAIIAGLGYAADYSSRPGSLATAPSISGTSLDNVRLRPRLVVFIHPQCPCSRATVSEIERLSERAPGAFDIEALFYKPEDKPEEWVKTDVWNSVSRIEGARLSIVSEKELAPFGTVTSGQVMLYSTADRLVFSGGITRARGHEGYNPGIDSVETYLRTGAATVSENPVFGCIISSAEPINPANRVSGGS
jgi:hypothetical protein